MSVSDPSKFNKTSYDLSDQWAISRVTKWLIQNEYTIIPKEKEDYWIDITAEKNGIREFYECETKAGYPFTCMEDFKFDTVSFLARKEKWKDVGFYYFIICRETEAYVYCHSSIIFRDQYREKINVHGTYRKGIDHFYRVPKDLCVWGSFAPRETLDTIFWK